MTGTPDLLAALEDIERLAKHTQLNIAAGLATSGASGLRKIELAAQDARRWATVDTDRKQATTGKASIAPDSPIVAGVADDAIRCGVAWRSIDELRQRAAEIVEDQS